MTDKQELTQEPEEIIKPAEYLALMLTLRAANLTIWRFFLVIIMALTGFMLAKDNQPQSNLYIILSGFIIFSISNGIALYANIQARMKLKETFKANCKRYNTLKDVVDILSPFDVKSELKFLSNFATNMGLYVVGSLLYCLYLLYLIFPISICFL
jgi:hypothetical protein